jgi:DNA-binding transcriptional LysR family regulator
MELLQLRYFQESATNGSFAKTAEAHNVPATSVSASVKRLEKELGCSLFDRACNRIQLNENGKLFLKTVDEILRKLEHAVHALQREVDDDRQIRMLVRTTRGEITNAIIAFKQKFPKAIFRTVFDFSETDYDSYDIVIDEQKDDYSGYDRFLFMRTRIRIKAAAKNPLCGKPLTLRQLASASFISIGEQNSMNKILINACRQAGFHPNIAIQCNDIKCYEECLAADVGIALGREYPNAVLSDRIRYLNVTDFDEVQTICCYYKSASAYGIVGDFLRFLQEQGMTSV